MAKKSDWPSSLSTAERISGAEMLCEKGLDLLISLIHLHECNREAFYSDVLSKQIPLSYAGNTYKVFSNAMESTEIIRICRIWDPATGDRNSLPSLAALLDDDAVLEEILKRHLAIHGADQTFFRARHDELKAAIAEIKSVASSPLCRALKHYRDHALAHSLIADPAKNPSLKARRGDERRLLEAAISLIDKINVGVRRSSFDWEDARLIARENAQELWQNCVFTIPDYRR